MPLKPISFRWSKTSVRLVPNPFMYGPDNLNKPYHGHHRWQNECTNKHQVQPIINKDAILVIIIINFLKFQDQKKHVVLFYMVKKPSY